MAQKTRPLRALYARTVTNGQLVNMVVAAARVAAARMRWPNGLDRDAAPEIIHEYLKRHKKYRAEGPGAQKVRLPSALVKDRTADCKSTAVFLAGALAAAGHQVTLRFIRQRGARGAGYSHVYVTTAGTAVDPLLPFGMEALYLTRKDIPIS